MGNISAIFLGKEYSIPEDVLVYIDLLDFTESVKKQLVNAFVRKLNAEIKKGNTACLDDKDLSVEMEQQIGRFIAKLCDNGIFNRTINDYLRNNKGFQLFSDVNRAALEKMKSLLIREIDSWQAGFEDALLKKESSVTGMGFSIWSSSFINHAIYAAMEASTVDKQEKAATVQYQKDMSELRARLNSQYGGEKSAYVHNTYIPNMETALTVFAYELLDKYLSDLIANGKFDGKTLEFVNIDRSNDLLKNLTLSNNKKAIIENAFATCPYNMAVYTQAIKYDLLDYESFQTAKVFEQSDAILSFLQNNWGQVSYPTAFNIDYHCIELLALFTDTTPIEVLRSRTEKYVTEIIKAYADLSSLISDPKACRKVIRKHDDREILAGDTLARTTARSFVRRIVRPEIWDKLMFTCGHADLLERIVAQIPDGLELQRKNDLDVYFTEQLMGKFEEARKELADQIIAKQQEELTRIQAEEQAKEELRLQRVKCAKKVKKVAIIFFAVVLFVFTVLVSVNMYIDRVVIPSAQYANAIELLEAGEYQAAYDIFASLDGYKESAAFMEQCALGILDNAYNAAIELMNARNYSEAITAFKSLDGYKNSNEMIAQCQDGVRDESLDYIFELIQKENYVEAIELLTELGDYKNATQQLTIAKYGYACELLQNGVYGESIQLFTELGAYEDCEEKCKEAQYRYANALMSDKKYSEARALFLIISDYKDSASKIDELDIAIYRLEQLDVYNSAISLAKVSDFQSALDKLNTLQEPVQDSEELKELYKTVLPFVGVWTVVELQDSNGFDSAGRRFHYALIAKYKGDKVYFYFGLVAEYSSDGIVKANISDEMAYELQGNKLVYVGERNLLQKPQFWLEGDVLVQYSPEATATNGYHVDAETEKYVRVKQ